MPRSSDAFRFRVKRKMYRVLPRCVFYKLDHEGCSDQHDRSRFFVENCVRLALWEMSVLRFPYSSPNNFENRGKYSIQQLLTKVEFETRHSLVFHYSVKLCIFYSFRGNPMKCVLIKSIWNFQLKVKPIPY